MPRAKKPKITTRCPAAAHDPPTRRTAELARQLDEAERRAEAMASALRDSEQQRHEQAATARRQHRALLVYRSERQEQQRQLQEQRALLQNVLQALSMLAELGGEESMESQDSAWRRVRDVYVQIFAELNDSKDSDHEDASTLGRGRYDW